MVEWPISERIVANPFNAGRHLRDEEVPRVVERLLRLGDVYEVQSMEVRWTG